MKRSSYGERDYAFGQMILTLRSHIGLTQTGLADLLGVSRRAVAEWEGGSSYPKAEHLKAFLTLCVRASAFPAGREAEEIHVLWRAAHQKVLLDELWLQELLGTQRPPLVVPKSVEQTSGDDHTLTHSESRPRVDWGEAMAVPIFYGRTRELAQLTEWVVQEHCRVVSVLGMGGIGKSALVVSLMRQVAPHFEVVLWRSLRDAPDCSALLEDCLQELAPQLLSDVPPSLDGRLGLLLNCLRETHTLLVLDNLETLLEESVGASRMREGYEGYVRLLRRMAETAHQSCLLLTSREKPSELVPLEGGRAPVRSLRLEGLELEAGEQLLEERALVGSVPDRERLLEAYGGNPLALKIVAETIVELFGGEIAGFLAGGESIFGSVRELLDEQFARLTAVEQTVLLWLAILREPVTIEGLLTLLGTPLPRVQVLEAVEALRRRSLIEQGHQRGSFTLQAVVLEYATARLISDAASEIEQGRLERLIELRLSLASVKEYIWQIQQRLIVAPLLAQLRHAYQRRGEVEELLLALLDQLRELADYAQGYGPANMISLLRVQLGHLRGLDLSQLAIRGASLRGVEMQDTRLSGATVRDTTFTETFDAIGAVAISSNGQYWAAGSRSGEVRVWHEEGQTLHLVWQAHTDFVWGLAFSPDGRTLASGSPDGSLKLWDAERRALLWSGRQTKAINCLAFSPDGNLLASSGLDATVRLWDPKLGIPLQELPHPGPIFALAWSPDGGLLASGDFAGTIRLWQRQPTGPARCAQTLEGHSNLVRGLAFAPDGRSLASAGWDGTVKLWDRASGRCLQTLSGHTQRVHCIAWSPDGGTLASGGSDHTIWLWEAHRRTARVALQGHSAEVYSLVFSPDSRHLLSSSEDGTLRQWNVERGETLRVLQGYVACLLDLDWSPDGTQLASASSDTVVSLWEVADRARGRPRGMLRGHQLSVNGVAWRPDGGVLASSGTENAIRLWDPATSSCLEVIRGLDHPDTVFFGLAWSPDGKLLACGTLLQGVLLWEATTRSQHWVGRGQPTFFRRVAWSADGTRLVAGGDDGHIYVWNASDGRLLQQLAGHQGAVANVAWSPDGTRLVSGGGSRGKGELFIWDARSGERLYTLNEPSEIVFALAWSPTNTMVINGGSDGMLRWWDLQHGECVHVRKAHQGAVQSIKNSPDGRKLASCGDDGAINIWDMERGEHLRTLRRDRPYERLDISGVKGLTEAQKASLRALGAVEKSVFTP